MARYPGFWGQNAVISALTGTTSPALLAVSLTGAAIGVVGLIAEARSPASATLEEVTSS